MPAKISIFDGRAVLILDYGAIGQHVARLCRDLGMHVMAVRRQIPAAALAESAEQGIYPASQLRQLLPSADALVLCVPATVDTIGMIGSAELALLPRHAVLVNVSRGVVVDECDYESPSSGQWSGNRTPAYGPSGSPA
uniref:D-isomer specific 2-hydroxyacid dehydrogenase NAD-binding domain-containing protein n=1 Tax=Thermosporothrix sp. COM3 TaxID=2490863 RepID=A0A455SC59_9CHLR|nr:hypothetical protein KTC_00970 [Thermosporothrix sp. COM3]